MNGWWVVAAVVCGLFAVFAFRSSTWHGRESEYWARIGALVYAFPERDAYFRPLLMWARDHPPSAWEKVRGWVPPDRRRHAATNGRTPVDV